MILLIGKVALSFYSAIRSAKAQQPEDTAVQDSEDASVLAAPCEAQLPEDTAVRNAEDTAVLSAHEKQRPEDTTGTAVQNKEDTTVLAGLLEIALAHLTVLGIASDAPW